jgi:flavin reductase (DIM6/NTAB) family NADH-FMN oxidoreductase RutF
MFSANQTPSSTQKDTVKNVEATGVFCWSLATYELREYVNATAEQLASDIDEFEHAGIEKEDAKLNAVVVKGKKMMVPMVKRSPVKFECTYYTTLRLPGNPPMGTADIVIGRVIGVHIDESVLTNGRIDVKKTVPIARLGYFEYAKITETFEMEIPGDEATRRVGLEGSMKGNRAMQKAIVDGEKEEDVGGGVEMKV